MALADKNSDQQQILQAAFDVSNQALKTSLPGPITVNFEGGTQEVEISADSDNIAIADASTGTKAKVTSDGRLQVQTAGDTTVTGSVTIPPSTDFQAKTVTVTTTPTQLMFSSLTQVSAVTLTSPNDNTGDIKVGKSDVMTNYYLLSPGAAVNLPVYAGASVFLVRDSGAGSYRITALAVN